MRKIFIFIFCCFVFLIGFLFFYFYNNSISLKDHKTTLCFDNLEKSCFLVDLAKTYKEKQKGLMFEEYLEKEKGMLFVFDKEGIYPFWMKNTLIPLDIIWIDKNKKVVFVNENTQPCSNEKELNSVCPSINPEINARYVLEINAGLVKELKIEIGDYAYFDI